MQSTWQVELGTRTFIAHIIKRNILSRRTGSRWVRDSFSGKMIWSGKVLSLRSKDSRDGELLIVLFITVLRRSSTTYYEK